MQSSFHMCTRCCRDLAIWTEARNCFRIGLKHLWKSILVFILICLLFNYKLKWISIILNPAFFQLLYTTFQSSQDCAGVPDRALINCSVILYFLISLFIYHSHHQIFFPFLYISFILYKNFIIKKYLRHCSKPPEWD
jgi:hypothetical protein